jgi:hypothetical protein
MQSCTVLGDHAPADFCWIVEHSRLLKNYRLAHERIEDQRLQMLEQEKQVRPGSPI